MKHSKKYISLLKILISIFAIAILYACGAGSSSSATPTISNTPKITLFSMLNLTKSIVNCANFNSNVAAINNNGIVAGFIMSPKNNDSLQCQQHDYLWNSESSNSLSIIPLPNSPFPAQEEVFGARIAALSTNLISAGIAFAGNPQDVVQFASYNQNLLPYIINSGDEVLGVSENGQFLAGANSMTEELLLFNTILKQPTTLTLDGKPFIGGAELISVSNNGTAVGIYNDTNISQNGIAIICKNATQNCQIVDKSNQYISSVRSISSDGQIIYGVQRNNNDNTIFQVNPVTYSITPLFKGYTIYLHYNVTDSGAILVTPDAGDSYFIYVPKIGVYSVATLIHNLHLPSNIDSRTATLSPNGKYIAFDVSSYTNNQVIGAKVFFPLGIERYLKDNIIPIAVNY